MSEPGSVDEFDRQFTQDYLDAREGTKRNPAPPYKVVVSDAFSWSGERGDELGPFATFEEAVWEARQIFDPVYGKTTIGEVGVVYDASGSLVWSGSMEQDLPPQTWDRTAALQNPIELLSLIASRLTLDQIKNLTDDEIRSLAVPRPGHPGQTGFLLSLLHFDSLEHLARISHALIQRLGAAHTK